MKNIFKFSLLFAVLIILLNIKQVEGYYITCVSGVCWECVCNVGCYAPYDTAKPNDQFCNGKCNILDQACCCYKDCSETGGGQCNTAVNGCCDDNDYCTVNHCCPNGYYWDGSTCREGADSCTQWNTNEPSGSVRWGLPWEQTCCSVWQYETWILTWVQIQIY